MRHRQCAQRRAAQRHKTLAILLGLQCYFPRHDVLLDLVDDPLMLLFLDDRDRRVFKTAADFADLFSDFARLYRLHVQVVVR